MTSVAAAPIASAIGTTGLDSQRGRDVDAVDGLFIMKNEHPALVVSATTIESLMGTYQTLQPQREALNRPGISGGSIS